MTFSTEKNKLFKIWQGVENNKNIIINQKSDNHFIVQNTNVLNNQNTSFPILTDFTTGWLTPQTLTAIAYIEGVDTEYIVGNYQEFRLTFNNPPTNFVPYIHAEVLYRFGESGIIPTVNGDTPFDNDIADSFRLEKSEMFQTTDTTTDYITYMRMDFEFPNYFEIQYKFICHLLNPFYYN